MLTRKNAIIYGAGGSLAGAIARAFAAAGATLFLTGPHPETIQKLAAEIKTTGGRVHVAKVDALNEEEVNKHLQSVVEQAGTADISFNLVDLQPVQGLPLVDMAMTDFVRPVTIAMQSHFITATAAGKVMMKQRSGVILSLSATSAGIAYPLTGAFSVACCAMECFSRTLASEIGIYDVRVVNIRSAGSPDSRVFLEALGENPNGMKMFLDQMAGDTMLKRLPLIADIANTAAFLASDMANAITGVTVDVTCGTTTALNYKTTDMAKNLQAKS